MKRSRAGGPGWRTDVIRETRRSYAALFRSKGLDESQAALSSAAVCCLFQKRHQDRLVPDRIADFDKAWGSLNFLPFYQPHRGCLNREELTLQLIVQGADPVAAALTAKAAFGDMSPEDFYAPFWEAAFGAGAAFDLAKLAALFAVGEESEYGWPALRTHSMKRSPRPRLQHTGRAWPFEPPPPVSKPLPRSFTPGWCPAF